MIQNDVKYLVVITDIVTFEKFYLNMARTRLYSTAVEGDYAFLDEMKKCALRINEQQIFSHIFLGRYKEKDVEDLIEDIGFIRIRFQKERREIAEFAEDYNSMYATDNNGCFSVVFKFCRLLRATLRGAMAIFRNFCARKSHRLICRDGKQVRLSVHTHSDLGAQYTQMLIPFNEEELIPPKLRELSNLLIDFFVEITDVIGICSKVMSEEIKIRKDYPRLKRIYDDTIEEIQEMGLVALNIINCPDSIDEVEDTMTREMLQTGEDGLNDILPKYFHKKTLKELRSHYLLLQAFQAKFAFTPTEEEKTIFGKDNWDKIMKIRLAIKYFDDMEPKGSINHSKGIHRLKGKSIAMLLNWCGIMYEDRCKGAFMKYFNKNYKGEYLPLGDTAVYEQFGNWKDKEYKEFEEKLNSLVEEKKKTEAKVA